MRDLDYLKLLAKEYPTVKAASSEIINLMAIRGLPKGTEYFFSDLHGEYEAFIHLLRSASGIIREKISETFGYVISDEEEIALANLIYYPERNIRRIQKEGKFTEDWQRITIYRLVRICKEVSSKFTRSKVRKKMPPAFAYIIDELLHVDYNDDNKKVYYDEIIHSIIDIGMGDEFIKALGAEAFQERIDKAENSFMYEIGVLEKEYDRTDPAESTKFEREAAAKLVTFREKLERENYMRAVCDRFHIELQGMRELVASLGSKEGILRRNDYPAASGQQRAAAPKKKKEDGVRQAEKILLTWMIEDAGIFEKVKEYISPQDFVNPLFKDVADKLYAQYESGSLNPAAIISTYDAEETHSEVAAMFSMELDNRLNHNEREKALNDTVLKVKNNSIQYQIDQAADPAQIQQLYTMKNKLSAIHITL